MCTREDPLTQEQSPDRVFYATGVMLDAQDFLAEQNYHRGRLARALAALDGYGTIAGLEVKYELSVASEGGVETPVEMLMVNPGVAIDRLGRLIEVPRRTCIRLNRWYESFAQSSVSTVSGQLVKAFKPGPLPISGVSVDTLDVAGETNPGDTFNGVVVADVFLHFHTCDRGKTPAFASGPFDALDSVQPSRLRDGYRLSLVLRQEGDLGMAAPLDLWGALSEMDISTSAARRAIFTGAQDAILSAWTDGLGESVTPPEYPADMEDQSGVMLARLAIKTHQLASGEVPLRPAALPDGAVVVDNYRRPFVITPQALGLGAIRLSE